MNISKQAEFVEKLMTSPEAIAAKELEDVRIAAERMADMRQLVQAETAGEISYHTLEKEMAKAAAVVHKAREALKAANAAQAAVAARRMASSYATSGKIEKPRPGSAKSASPLIDQFIAEMHDLHAAACKIPFPENTTVVVDFVDRPEAQGAGSGDGDAAAASAGHP